MSTEFTMPAVLYPFVEKLTPDDRDDVLALFQAADLDRQAAHVRAAQIQAAREGRSDPQTERAHRLIQIAERMRKLWTNFGLDLRDAHIRRQAI